MFRKRPKSSESDEPRRPTELLPNAANDERLPAEERRPLIDYLVGNLVRCFDCGARASDYADALAIEVRQHLVAHPGDAAVTAEELVAALQVQAHAIDDARRAEESTTTGDLYRRLAGRLDSLPRPPILADEDHKLGEAAETLYEIAARIDEGASGAHSE